MYSIQVYCWILIYWGEFQDPFGTNIKSSWDLDHNRFSFNSSHIFAFLAHTLPWNISKLNKMFWDSTMNMSSCFVFLLFDTWEVLDFAVKTRILSTVNLSIQNWVKMSLKVLCLNNYNLKPVQIRIKWPTTWISRNISANSSESLVLW